VALQVTEIHTSDCAPGERLMIRSVLPTRPLPRVCADKPVRDTRAAALPAWPPLREQRLDGRPELIGDQGPHTGKLYGSRYQVLKGAQAAERALLALREVLNSLNGRLRDTEMKFNLTAHMNDAVEILHVVGDGLVVRDQRQRAPEQGRVSPPGSGVPPAV
jgi:hypothetical protein